MNNKTQRHFLAAAVTAAVSLLIGLAAGCQTSSIPPSSAFAAATPVAAKRDALLLSAGASPASPPADANPAPSGRAQLWSQTCKRCHNVRSPDSYGPNEWAIIMTHMRVRGYLTGQEQRQIQDFLQSQ